MAAPMPRAAPVTSATLPVSGRSQSSVSGPGATAAPIRTTWPETNADLGESRKRSVDSS